MNVNKKFNRFKQWAGERMGQEVQTDTSEDFKALEVEMQLRHEGEPDAVAIGRVDLTWSRNGENATFYEEPYQALEWRL